MGNVQVSSLNSNNPIIHKPLIVVIALIGSEEQAFT